MSETPLIYKGRPMVRQKNEIVYGNLSDKYILHLTIQSYKKEGEEEIADKVHLALESTNPELPQKDKIMRQADRIGLYNALDIGTIWLERALLETNN